eukprot:30854-Pelagococcus_subviridis.AAC.13
MDSNAAARSPPPCMIAPTSSDATSDCHSLHPPFMCTWNRESHLRYNTPPRSGSISSGVNLGQARRPPLERREAVVGVVPERVVPQQRGLVLVDVLRRLRHRGRELRGFALPPRLHRLRQRVVLYLSMVPLDVFRRPLRLLFENHNRALVPARAAVIRRAEHRVHSASVRHLAPLVDALMRSHERRELLAVQKRVRRVATPQHSGAARARFEPPKPRARMRVAPHQVLHPLLVAHVVVRGEDVRPAREFSNVPQPHGGRLTVDHARPREPREDGVKRLEHGVVVLSEALLLEPAVDVYVRLLVVPSVHVHAVWARELQGEDQQAHLACVVAAIDEVAVEDVNRFLARQPLRRKHVQQVVYLPVQVAHDDDFPSRGYRDVDNGRLGREEHGDSLENRERVRHRDALVLAQAAEKVLDRPRRERREGGDLRRVLGASRAQTDVRADVLELDPRRPRERSERLVHGRHDAASSLVDSVLLAVLERVEDRAEFLVVLRDPSLDSTVRSLDEDRGFVCVGERAGGLHGGWNRRGRDAGRVRPCVVRTGTCFSWARLQQANYFPIRNLSRDATRTSGICGEAASYFPPAALFPEPSGL